MAFTSLQYVRDAENRIVADSSKLGVWYVAPGAAHATLLVSGERGAAQLIGLSPAGDAAAVWYLPERRNANDPPCRQGIYVVSTSDGKSRLVLEGDWPWGPCCLRPSTPLDYIGRERNIGEESYWLPEVSFSADGRSLALIAPRGEGITVIRPGSNPVIRRHAAQCSSWAWSPKGSRFVAGCAEMTTAWTIDLEQDAREATHALSIPKRLRGLGGGWSFARIGLTDAGDMRVVRFRHSEWSETTIDITTGRSTSRFHNARFVGGQPIFLSADASWGYVPVSARSLRDRTRILLIDSGVARATPWIGGSISAAADGRHLFGVRSFRDGGPRYVVVSLNRMGVRRDVGTIDWPSNADHEGAGPLAYVIAVSAPRS